MIWSHVGGLFGSIQAVAAGNESVLLANGDIHVASLALAILLAHFLSSAIETDLLLYVFSIGRHFVFKAVLFM